jgi:hypothetical protein
MDILGPHSTTYDTHLTLTLLYPVILCSLTLERIRHDLLTLGSFVETRSTVLSSAFFFLIWFMLQCHISFNDTTRVVQPVDGVDEEVTLFENIQFTAPVLQSALVKQNRELQ